MSRPCLSIYARAHSLGSKQEELEAFVRQATYELVALTETWGHHSHDWSTVMDGYKLFRRDRRGRKGGGVSLYIKEFFDVEEPGVGNDKVECLWKRLRGKACRGDILVGVCYRPPHQDEEMGEAFCEQLAKVTRSPALVLTGDFNIPDIGWKHNTAQRKQSRRFLECVEDSYLTQLVGEPTRGGALLDLLLATREGLVGDVKVGDCLGQSDHEIVEFAILGDVRRVTSKTAVLNFRRADFDLFRTLVAGVSWFQLG